MDFRDKVRFILENKKQWVGNTIWLDRDFGIYLASSYNGGYVGIYRIKTTFSAALAILTLAPLKDYPIPGWNIRTDFDTHLDNFLAINAISEGEIKMQTFENILILLQTGRKTDAIEAYATLANITKEQATEAIENLLTIVKKVSKNGIAS